MALKVFLADDSAAIKKVVQLSLQDLGVELKTVGSGKDALDAARQFKPDIAFIDVLLPQKSGYEVTAELKKDPSLKNVPVIMLWSAFMAFDEAKYKSCGAQAKLEKPFDVEALRKLVNEFVPKAESNPFAANLDFPAVHFEQPIGSVPPPKKTKAASIPESPPKPAPAEWGTTAFEDINSFASKMENSEETMTRTQHHVFEKPAPTTPTPTAGEWGSDNEWVRKDLGKFKVPVPEEALVDENPAGAAVAFQYTEEKIVDTSFLFKPTDESTFTNKTPDEPLELESHRSDAVLSLEELSDIKRETREIIERVVWKVVPEIASQIIKDELQRLLSEDK